MKFQHDIQFHLKSFFLDTYMLFQIKAVAFNSKLINTYSVIFVRYHSREIEIWFQLDWNDINIIRLHHVISIVKWNLNQNQCIIRNDVDFYKKDISNEYEFCFRFIQNNK